MRAGGATDGLAMTDATAGVAADDAAGAAGSFGTNALPSQRSSGSLIVLLCAALSVARERSVTDAEIESSTAELDIFAKATCQEESWPPTSRTES